MLGAWAQEGAVEKPVRLGAALGFMLGAWAPECAIERPVRLGAALRFILGAWAQHGALGPSAELSFVFHQSKADNGLDN